MKQQVKMRVLDWYIEDTEKNFYENHFIKLLQKKYDVIYSEQPDFIIYGDHGYEHLKYECVRIFVTCENFRTNWNIADYGIDMDYIDVGDRHLRLPYVYIHYFDFLRCFPKINQYDTQEVISNILFKHDKSNDYKKRIKFCAFVASNHGDKEYLFRNTIFDKLCEYKKVDSGGKWKNNIGKIVHNKIEWLKDYKFNLCYENSSYPGYLTEKIFDAFAAGCIPIYWGDNSLNIQSNQKKFSEKGFALSNQLSQTFSSPTNVVHNNKKIQQNWQSLNYYNTPSPIIPYDLIEFQLNPNAFINTHNFNDIESFLNQIKEIDADQKLYEAMLKEPVFLNNFNLFEYYEKKLINFFDYIILQGKDVALRRGFGQRMLYHKEMLEDGVLLNTIPFVKKHYSYFHALQRTINLCKAIVHTPRTISRCLRKIKKD